MSTREQDRAAGAVERIGGAFAAEAGIRLKDTPQPLYELLVLATLLSARISADIAVAAARELFSAGMRSPEAMRDATRRQRVAALGRGRYRRYDERTSTMLGDGAELVLERWQGDLRRLQHGDVGSLRAALEELPGIGPVGSAIFCREVQGVWPDVAPFTDDKVLDGAARLGLPTDGHLLAALVPDERFPDLAGACVRVSLRPALAGALDT